MKYVVYLFIAVALACNSKEMEKPAEAKMSFFEWISDQPDARFEMEFSWDSLMVHRESEEPIKCNLRVVSDQNTYPIPATISTRGVHRKTACDFPPLKLILDKDFVEKMNWSKPRKYKLVTPCEGPETDHLYREYVTYKLQELHTPYHLESLLIPSSYTMGDKQQRGHLVLLEHEEEMARRLDFDLQDPQKQPIKIIHEREYENLVLFQYLIGNTDWNLTRGHNINWLVRKDQSTSPIPVAYDFDQCGLVDAPYAAPYPTLPIQTVRDRLLQYRGKDRTRLAAPWDQVLSQRERSLQLIAEFQYLKPQSKIEMSEYLEQGYKSDVFK